VVIDEGIVIGTVADATVVMRGIVVEVGGVIGIEIVLITVTGVGVDGMNVDDGIDDGPNSGIV